MSDSSLEKIHAAIPHRSPMLLVDEIVSQSDHEIVCRRTFSEDEYFFQGHYPDQPLVPGVILCEATVQSGAILLSNLAKDLSGKPVLTRMGDVKFKKMVLPGDTIEMVVKLDEVVSNAYYLTGITKCNGKVAVRLNFTCSIAEVG
jgi:3-hydroxyacyl-[acyl-carrier-protein] dehydratase